MKWHKLKIPFYILAGAVALYLLWWSPFPALLKYAGSIVTMIGAIGGYWHKSVAEGKKEVALRSPLDADRFALCAIIGGALVSMSSNRSDDIAKSNSEAAQKRNEVAQQKHFDKVAADQKQREDHIYQSTQKANNTLSFANQKLDLAQHESQLAHRETTIARAEIQAARNESFRSAKQNQFLTTAQGQLTRLKIASESIKGFDANLRNFERTVNPIQTVQLTFYVHIPLDDPNLSDYRSNLQQKLIEYVKYLKTLKPGSPDYQNSDFKGFFTTFSANRNGKETISYGFGIKKGSDLFPDNSSALPGSIFLYQSKLLFWHKSQNIQDTQRFPNLSSLPLADVTITTLAPIQQQELIYTPGDGKLHLMCTATVPASKVGGRIATIPDLFGSHVTVVRNIFRDNQGRYNPTPKPSNLEKHCSIERILFEISGRVFDFETQDLNYYVDPKYGIACQFTFKDTQRNWRIIRDVVNR